MSVLCDGISKSHKPQWLQQWQTRKDRKTTKLLVGKAHWIILPLFYAWHIRQRHLASMCFAGISCWHNKNTWSARQFKWQPLKHRWASFFHAQERGRLIQCAKWQKWGGSWLTCKNFLAGSKNVAFVAFQAGFMQTICDWDAMTISILKVEVVANREELR